MAVSFQGGINIKRWWISLFTALIILCLIPATISAKSFGPNEWNQYRMQDDKNAVFDNDSDPIDYTEFETEDEIRSTPVIAEDKMFIGNHDSGGLFAFNVKTGEKIWENEAPNWIHSEMIYHDGMVYVGFGNRYFQDNGIRGTGESGVLALDAETGDIEWKYNTDGEVMPTPAYKDGSLYITTGDRYLYKLNPSTGDLKHKEELGHTVSMSAPNISGDSLYVGGSGPKPYTFSAYDLQEDEIEWQREFPDVFAGLDDVPSAVSDDIVVTTALEGDSDNPEHFMYALDTETGELIWKESLGTGDFVENNKSGAPIIYDGKVYVGSPITETFYAYDLKTGEELWSFEDEIMKAPPVAQGGVVYFSNTEGLVYALDAESGDIVGKKELNGTLAPAGPVIMNETMFVGSQDSNVYAVPLDDIVSEENPANSKSDTEEGNLTIWLLVGALIVVMIVLILFSTKRVRNK